MKAVLASLAFTAVVAPHSLGAQIFPPLVREFHDQVTEIIKPLAARPLTPGDTMLTWNPRPGGLIHTVAVSASGVSSSLLRADGMIGTASSRWEARSAGIIPR